MAGGYDCVCYVRVFVSHLRVTGTIVCRSNVLRSGYDGWAGNTLRAFQILEIQLHAKIWAPWENYSGFLTRKGAQEQPLQKRRGSERERKEEK